MQEPLVQPQASTQHEVSRLDTLAYVGAEPLPLLGPPLIHMPTGLRMAAASAASCHAEVAAPSPALRLGSSMKLAPLISDGADAVMGSPRSACDDGPTAGASGKSVAVEEWPTRGAEQPLLENRSSSTSKGRDAQRAWQLASGKSFAA